MKGLLGEGLVARDMYLVQKGDGRMELSILPVSYTHLDVYKRQH